ncbi:MAG: electron transport complex subunit RsxC [Xanthomonadales bacterium]|nr:electron transport complex subunit RsxC [Xanthomonadales bacterium]
MTDRETLEQARRAGEQMHHFPGGLHLRHNKRISCELPIALAPLPAQLSVPLLQYSGDEAKPIVSSGQSVLKGEEIAASSHPHATPLHAPTSGTIVAIEPRPASHPSGLDGLSIVIETDGADRWKDLQPLAGWRQAEPSLLRKKIRDAGIVGLGGAMFPTSAKVDSGSVRDVHTLILNGAECEPFISCDEMLMREQPAAVVLGAQVLQRAVGASRTVIAIEDRMGAVSDALQRALNAAGASDIDLVKVTTIYPEGGEKQLVQILTGLEVPSGGTPLDLGLLCQNVATAAAAAQAVVEGKPLIERIVTVTGNGVLRPRNLLALIGTPIELLINECGGYTPTATRLVLGGPMMGYALRSDANPVTAAANCVLVLTEAELQAPQPEMPCIRCGECGRVCPAMLLPQELNRFVRNGLWSEAADYGLKDCIECGCCDFVCPSQIPLVDWFRYGKAELRLRARERREAECARQRFEAREARLEQENTERKRRREEKKRALGNDQEKQRRIADAVERARRKHDS